MDGGGSGGGGGKIEFFPVAISAWAVLLRHLYYFATSFLLLLGARLLFFAFSLPDCDFCFLSVWDVCFLTRGEGKKKERSVVIKKLLLQNYNTFMFN